MLPVAVTSDQFFRMLEYKNMKNFSSACGLSWVPCCSDKGPISGLMPVFCKERKRRAAHP